MLKRALDNRRRWLSICLLLVMPVTAYGWQFELQQGDVETALPDIAGEGWAVTGLRLALTDTKVNIDASGPGALPANTRVSGGVRLTISEIRHAALKPQRWDFNGEATGTLADIRLEGQLRSEEGLVADVILHTAVDGRINDGRLSIRIGAEQAATVLRRTLADWPEFMELSEGSLDLQARVQLRPDAPMVLHGRLDLDNVSALIDRTALSGASGHLLFSLEGEQLTARLREVNIGQINSGIGIGPVQLLADYRAPRDDLLAGALDIQQATAEFLDGQVRVAPGTLDLGHRPLQVPLAAYELSLERLLEVYPAQGFAGTGRISGQIPLAIGEHGLTVEDGHVQALSPGGRLRLPAERLQGMLGTSAASELVTRALQNFHYSVLNSTIDYDESGKLTLGLRLEGNNPEVGRGQPVALNINLEEDIPALLTSLQLSGRVNEAVAERVRERLEQTGQEGTP